MKTFRTEAIIIKRRNFRELDKILTVFTKKRGKIQIKAAGVRKITSRRAPHIELLNYSILSLYEGKGWPILTEAVSIKDFSLIKKELIKVGFAYHLCELIDGLCPENQENRRVFHLLLETLQRLSEEENIAEIIHEFEIELLSILGFYKFSNSSSNFDTSSFIENILERKLKSKRLISKLS
ncbi:MAG: DNA repair protein RecO [bacterium]|nr:DNA repair protein RecO [bacterium]